jgi:hypothetical protein
VARLERWLRVLWLRIRSLFLRNRVEQELADEPETPTMFAERLHHRRRRWLSVIRAHILDAINNTTKRNGRSRHSVRP